MSINFPFGHADVTEITDEATPTLVISNTYTIAKVSAGLSQASEIAISTKRIPIGSKIKIDIQQGATGQAVTFGNSTILNTEVQAPILGPALVGVSNDRDTIELLWTGDEWINETIWNKIIDAA